MVKVGDTIEIISHGFFPGGKILPIGSRITVEAVNQTHQVVIYVYDKKHNLDWWIVPEDYKIIEEDQT